MVPTVATAAVSGSAATSGFVTGGGVGVASPRISVPSRPVSTMSSTLFAGTGSAAGRNTENVEPWPIVDLTSIVPPCWLMIRWLIARPRPVPFCLVV